MKEVRIAATSLRIDQSKLLLENEHVRVGLDPATGAVASLVHKKSGRETLDAKRGAFPHFTGRPNPNLSRKPSPPARYDSATSKGQLDWLATGPLVATLRAQHRWPYLTFETREYGWPLYAEYRHLLWPHAGELTNADRLRAAAAMARPLKGAVETDLLGRKTGEAAIRNGRLAFRIQPWKIRTFAVE